MAGITMGSDTISEHQTAVELADFSQKKPSVGHRSLAGNRGVSEQSSIAFEGNGTPLGAGSFTDPIVQSPPEAELSILRTAIVIGTVCTITMLNSMLSGVLVVALPTMAIDLGIPSNLVLWPSSVNALTCGSTLLISGSISDVVGGRITYLIGSFGLVLTTIFCALSQTGIQLILARAAQGLAVSLCLPSSTSLITANINSGQRRNIAFSCLGASQPIGFAIGLTVGGVFVEYLSWRYGYYVGAVLTFIIFVISVVGLPKNKSSSEPMTVIWTRLRKEIDWIGCGILSTSLGMFSYVLSVVAAGGSNIVKPSALAMLIIGVLLLPLFGAHVKREERHSRSAIIPLSLFKNRIFTCLCITVFLVWGIFNAITYFLTLFYQNIQSLSAIQTSIRFLPDVGFGIITNFITGLLVHRVAANTLVLSSAAISAISPLLLAFVNPKWSYWACAFLATGFSPVCGDVLFTVANLLITSPAVFPPSKHSLAGGVFQMVSQLGNSVGLAITAVIASSVTLAHQNDLEPEKEKLMAGYRATFWSLFGLSLAVLVIAGWGLRQIGKVGVKRE